MAPRDETSSRKGVLQGRPIRVIWKMDQSERSSAEREDAEKEKEKHLETIDFIDLNID